MPVKFATVSELIDYDASTAIVAWLHSTIDAPDEEPASCAIATWTFQIGKYSAVPGYRSRRRPGDGRTDRGLAPKTGGGVAGLITVAAAAPKNGDWSPMGQIAGTCECPVCGIRMQYQSAWRGHELTLQELLVSDSRVRRYEEDRPFHRARADRQHLSAPLRRTLHRSVLPAASALCGADSIRSQPDGNRGGSLVQSASLAQP